MKTDELEALRSLSAQQGTELAKVNEENRILKQAVRVQHGQTEKLRGEIEHRVRGEIEHKHRSEIEGFQNLGMHAAEHIRRLEATNYALRTHLEQMAPSHATDMGNGPRWGT
mmetsp:Transcript_5115/g.11289  ORF Transcript_5115/g.11289 Transcript_5115/m.11289 type:complete len:112 (+) Transcript_5115:523-858(+)